MAAIFSPVDNMRADDIRPVPGHALRLGHGKGCLHVEAHIVAIDRRK